MFQLCKRLLSWNMDKLIIIHQALVYCLSNKRDNATHLQVLLEFL